MADVYVIHPDGTGLRRLTEHGNFCGGPKWTSDSRACLAYCMPAEQTLETRRATPVPGTTRARVDRCGERHDQRCAGWTRREVQSVGLSAKDIGYIRKDSDAAGIYYTSGNTRTKATGSGRVLVPDGSRRRLSPPPGGAADLGGRHWSRNPEFELALTGILPSFGRDGGRFVVTGRPPAGSMLSDSSIAIAQPGIERARRSSIRTRRATCSRRSGRRTARRSFSVGVFNAFFNGFNSLFSSRAIASRAARRSR